MFRPPLPSRPRQWARRRPPDRLPLHSRDLVQQTGLIARFAVAHHLEGPPFAWDEDHRTWLRAELDAFYARKYGSPFSQSALFGFIAALHLYGARRGCAALLQS